MGLQTAFDSLSEVVEQVERHGRSIRDVEATTDPDCGGGLDVRMTVPVSLCGASDETQDPSLTPERASLTQSGRLTVTVSVSDLLPSLDETETIADVEEQAVEVNDGELLLEVGFQVDPADSTDGSTTTTEEATPTEVDSDIAPDDSATEEEDENDDTLAARLLAARPDEVPPDDMKPGESTEDADDRESETLTARLETVRTDSVPAYEDTDYLQTLYESCETFTEMSDHIEMDVAAETVRRYMIEADIHDPTTYDTATQESTEESEPSAGPDTPVAVAGDSDTALESAGPDQSRTTHEEIVDEQFVTDGIGLPEGVTVEDIVTAVVDATAVYEVQRSLGLSQSRTRSLLRQLNILDLVLHRISDRERELSEGDVLQRIRQCDAGTA